MERETKTIKTPSGKEAVIKSYLTAGERNQLRRIFLEGSRVNSASGQVNEFSGTLLEEAEKKLIELAIVSFDGSKETIYQRLLDERPEDYDYLIQELNALSTGGFPKAK